MEFMFSKDNTTVQFQISANHVAATKCIKECRHCQEVQRFYRPNFTKFQSNWFWPCNDCWCQTKWFECLRNCWSPGIFTHNSLQSLQRMLHKTSSEQQLCGPKRVVNERGQKRRARLVETDRKVTVTEITTLYKCGLQKSISEVKDSLTNGIWQTSNFIFHTLFLVFLKGPRTWRQLIPVDTYRGEQGISSHFSLFLAFLWHNTGIHFTRNESMTSQVQIY